MKWWREIAVWCGMSSCDFKCFVDKVVCSVQSSLLFLYYVVLCVMSVQYCLYVSVGFSVHSVQCQSIGSAQFYSVQCK